jgi:hypothetical protein
MTMLRLSQLIVQRAQQPFQWGVSDCAMWAFDCVRDMTGCDPAADLRGNYSNAREAMRLLRAEGGWASVCAARIGLAVPLPDVRDGDVVLLDSSACRDEMADVGALGVMWLGWVVAQGTHGLVQTPAAARVGAWRSRHG